MRVQYDPLPTDPTEKAAEDTHDRSLADDHDARFRAVPVGGEEHAQAGVKKVQASLRIYGRYSRWCLFVGLGLASYIYSLDRITTSAYRTVVMSSFEGYSLLASISVAQALIVAVGKPVIAKVADASSRGTACVGVLLFYVLGYTIIASASGVSAIAGGIILHAIGYTGLQILTQIMIADITALEWRGLVSSLVSAPFLVNWFVGPKIATAVLVHARWRWGYGMFAILLPVSLSPLIITLLWAERKTKKLGLLEQGNPPVEESRDGVDYETSTYGAFLQSLRRTAVELDLVGLVLLGAAVSLILLPLTPSQTVNDQWKNALMPSLLAVGVVVLCAFAYWDFRVATRPVIPPRFLRNRNVIFASLIGFFDSVSFNLTFTYLYSFVLMVKTWSRINTMYFMGTHTLALTFSGILAGVSMRFMHRFKYLLVLGLIVRLAGVAMMIHSRGANGSDVELVFTQILQGFGGGLAAVASQVGAQASVPHADVAITTAVVLLITEIGGVVGKACAGAIWTNLMPGNLAKYLPWLTDVERAGPYGDITLVALWPLGNPVRDGTIQAYDATMQVMVLCAVGLSVLPVLCALSMRDWHLGDKQNAVEGLDLTGRAVAGDDNGDDDGEGVVVSRRG